MKRKVDALGILSFLGIALIVVLLFSLLVLWTRAIDRQNRREQLKKTLKSVVREEGERALFELVDIPVGEILYGDEGLTVLCDDSGSWEYTFDEMQNMRVYESVGPSVVAVSGIKNPTGTLHETERGSGFILSENGYILTNAHVVEDCDSLTVGLSNERTFPAKVVGVSSIDDLALLRIDSNEILDAVELGESGKLKVGQKVLAIGNPFGYDRTLSVGVVGGLGRSVKTEAGKVIMNAIQTDVALNPGSSGGPLLNGKGEVVGINSSIFSTTGTNQGVSFAIPIDTVLSLIPDLISYGTVRRGWIDIVPVEITKAIASYGHLPVEEGILVSQVVEGGNAERAGLKGGSQTVRYGDRVICFGGDVIVGINGRSVKKASDLYLALLDTREGDVAKVSVLRDGKKKSIPVTLMLRQSEDVGSLVR